MAGWKCQWGKNEKKSCMNCLSICHGVYTCNDPLRLMLFSPHLMPSPSSILSFFFSFFSGNANIPRTKAVQPIALRPVPQAPTKSRRPLAPTRAYNNKSRTCLWRPDPGNTQRPQTSQTQTKFHDGTVHFFFLFFFLACPRAETPHVPLPKSCESWTSTSADNDVMVLYL